MRAGGGGGGGGGGASLHSLLVKDVLLLCCEEKVKDPAGGSNTLGNSQSKMFSKVKREPMKSQVKTT